MRGMTPEQRQQFLNSPGSRATFTPEEQQLLNGISRLPLAPGGTGEAPEE
jgi:hypothetical protein